MPIPNTPAQSQVSQDASELLSKYLNFLRYTQEVAEATIVLRRLHVKPFLYDLEQRGKLSQLSDLAPATVHDYIIKTSQPLARASRKHLVSALRSFLRFAHIQGHIERNLIEAVPVVLTRKLDHLPRAIPWDSVQKLLAAPDRNTPTGRRDYAILLLVASYAVRIGQAIHLQRQDVNWKQGLIYFPAVKYGKALCFPLLPVVAEALLTYIRKDRQEAACPDMFLTVRGVPRPMGINHHLGCAIKRYYQRAGLQVSRCGAHAIRHAFATRLLEQGTPLKAIADLLGHRSIETTFLYTKVDVERLRTFASEWPEVSQ